MFGNLEWVKWAGEGELAEGGSGLIFVLLKCINMISVRCYEISCSKWSEMLQLLWDPAHTTTLMAINTYIPDILMQSLRRSKSTYVKIIRHHLNSSGEKFSTFILSIILRYTLYLTTCISILCYFILIPCNISNKNVLLFTILSLWFI